jgi:hypothetical protein
MEKLDYRIEFYPMMFEDAAVIKVAVFAGNRYVDEILAYTREEAARVSTNIVLSDILHG